VYDFAPQTSAQTWSESKVTDGGLLDWRSSQDKPIMRDQNEKQTKNNAKGFLFLRVVAVLLFSINNSENV